MPWKIYRENTKSIGGDLPGAHIVPESERVLDEVQTRDEARQSMTRLMAEGMRPGDLYALGFDLPPIERRSA